MIQKNMTLGFWLIFGGSILSLLSTLIHKKNNQHFNIQAFTDPETPQSHEVKEDFLSDENLLPSETSDNSNEPRKLNAKANKRAILILLTSFALALSTIFIIAHVPKWKESYNQYLKKRELLSFISNNISEKTKHFLKSGMSVENACIYYVVGEAIEKEMDSSVEVTNSSITPEPDFKQTTFSLSIQQFNCEHCALLTGKINGWVENKMPKGYDPKTTISFWKKSMNVTWDTDSGRLDSEIARNTEEVLKEFEEMASVEEQINAPKNELKVIVKRAYFYDLQDENFIKMAPELFVIRGDKVITSRSKDMYMYVTFITKNGANVSGWLKQSDLQ